MLYVLRFRGTPIENGRSRRGALEPAGTEIEWFNLGDFQRFVFALCDVGGGLATKDSPLWWYSLRNARALPPSVAAIPMEFLPKQA
jgi:hypothetical protein